MFSFVGCQCDIFDQGSGNYSVCSAPRCPVGSRLLVEFVLLVLKSESCFLLQENDNLSAVSVCLRTRASIKSDLP